MRPPDLQGSLASSLTHVRRLLSRERLAIDNAGPGQTCFLSHIGARPKLVPGPWIGHRDLIYALARANLNPRQRISLARAVLVEHGREFGVGHLRLTALASGLPLGGSSLLLQPRGGGPTVVYAWALGRSPQPASCDWLVVRVQPEWALDDTPTQLSPTSLECLGALGGEVIIVVTDTMAAIQAAEACGTTVACAAHPRFAPHIDRHQAEAEAEAWVRLWPSDALDSLTLKDRPLVAIALVGASERIRQATDRWLHQRVACPADIPLRDTSCPGRADRPVLKLFWESCGKPNVLLTGDPRWIAPAQRWLVSLGATVVANSEATQLELIGS